MKVYQIISNIKNEENHERFIERIKAYGTFFSPIHSCWFITTNQSAAEVCDNLANVIDKTDSLLVTSIQYEMAGKGIKDDQEASRIKWLNQQLAKAA